MNLASAAKSVRLYTEPRQLVVFCIGVASGAPASLILSTLTFWNWAETDAEPPIPPGRSWTTV